MKDGKISEGVMKEGKSASVSYQMNEFLNDKEARYIPSFDSDDFEKHPDIIEKALSRPGTISNAYENMIGFS